MTETTKSHPVPASPSHAGRTGIPVRGYLRQSKKTEQTLFSGKDNGKNQGKHRLMQQVNQKRMLSQEGQQVCNSAADS